MPLDIPTLVILNCIISLINTGVLLFIWRAYRKHFAGLVFLLADMLFQTLGFFFSLLRNQLPPMLSIVLSNTLLITGALFVLIGLEIFFNSRRKHTINFLLIGIFICYFIYFGILQPNLMAREIGLSVVLCIFLGQACWLLMYQIPHKLRQVASFTLFSLSLYILVSVMRIIFMVAFPYQSNSFFDAGVVDAIAMIVYLSLSILITMSFVVLVSRRLLEEVQLEKEKYRVTYNTAPYAILLTRLKDGKIFEANEGFESITGYKLSEVIGKTTVELKLWRIEADRTIIMNELSNGAGITEREMQFRKKNGEIIDCLFSAKLIDVDNEKCVITNISNISVMVKIRRDLQEMATHDSMTGLPNRKLFYDRFEIAKANACREKMKIAVLSADIDLLKLVNDRYGHAAGDQLLVTLSQRMTSFLRGVDSVSRFGGDEFAFLIWGVKGQQDADTVIKNLKAKVAEPISIGEEEGFVTISIGSSVFPDDADNIVDLLRISDARMYDDKRNR